MRNYYKVMDKNVNEVLPITYTISHTNDREFKQFEQYYLGMKSRIIEMKARLDDEL